MPNQRQGVPAGWTWRDGRPRWIPSPTLRRAGWRAMDLKDRDGRFLARGASIDAAAAIVAAVDAWRGGRPVPTAQASIAPTGALAAGPPAPAKDRLSIGALADAWLASEEFARRAPGTQRDYRGKLKRLLDVLAGFVALPAPDDKAGKARHAAAVAQVRASSIFVLEPADTGAGISDPLHKAYWTLHGKAGVAQAAGVMAVASVWLTWCRKRQSRAVANWAADVSRETPPGRIRTATWDELQALVAAADKLAMPHVGDAVILGVDLSWSEVDLLALTWPRVAGDRAVTGEGGRIKTGRVGGTPLLPSLGVKRLAVIRARNQAAGVEPTHVVHLPRQRARKRTAAADGHLFRKHYAKVRAEAAKACPSVADLQFADLRDTGFSLGRAAGFTDDMTASRSLQSRKNIQQLGDRHYGEIGPDIADQGAVLLEAYVQKLGVKL